MRCSLLLLLLFVACVAPDQNDPVQYGTFIVALVPPIHHADVTRDIGPWRADQIDVLTKCYSGLGRLGPSFTIGSEATANLWLRPYDAEFDSMAKSEAGRYLVDTRKIIECDPARISGYGALCACAAHETGHWLGMQHICIKPNDAPDCSPAGYGLAIMNPSLAYDGNAYGDELSQSTPTELDLQELRRVRAKTAP